jgi:hypothetical protein
MRGQTHPNLCLGWIENCVSWMVTPWAGLRVGLQVQRQLGMRVGLQADRQLGERWIHDDQQQSGAPRYYEGHHRGHP